MDVLALLGVGAPFTFLAILLLMALLGAERKVTAEKFFKAVSFMIAIIFIGIVLVLFSVLRVPGY